MNLDPLWVSVGVTAILVIINIIYAYEMRKMRLESVKPIFSLRPSLVIRDEPMELYLLNNGDVAKDVNIDTFVNAEKKDLFFVASVPTNGEVDLDIGLKEIKEKEGKIDVILSYKNRYGKEKKEPLSLDYKTLSENERKLKHNYTVTEKMLERIGNGFILLHNDAESGKFKSDRITVYPMEKPKRGNRQK